MTRGHRGWLALQCAIPSFAALRRFIPAHVRTELRRPASKRVRPAAAALPASPRARPAVIEPLAPAATSSSSPPPPSSVTSSSGCGPSCAPRCPTATSPRSSSRPSPRRLQRLEARRFAGPRRRGRRSRRADLPHHAPDPGRGEASRLRAGRRAMPLRGRTGETMHGAPGARVPSPAPLRSWR